MFDLVKYNDKDGEDEWLNLDHENIISTEFKNNPLLLRDKFFDENIGSREISLFKNPEYIAETTYLITGYVLPPFQMVIQYNLWTHAFPMLIVSRGGSKTFSLALYSILKALLNPGYRVVLAGAAFRQSKLLFNNILEIWNKAPVLQSMCDRNSGPIKAPEQWTFRINDSTIIAIPIGPNGDKVRGLRANTVIVDEFAAHQPQIVEEVLAGFGAVRSNPIVKLRQAARYKKLKKLGHDTELLKSLSQELGNQFIVAGTAEYYYNHFYDYWKRYCAIINTKGNKDELSKLGIDANEDLDYTDYCVIRIPYSYIPEGFMDDKSIARSRTQMPRSLYLKEYEAIFVEDSDGFFKRSIIENCTAKEENINKPDWVEWCDNPFDAVIRGSLDKKYVMGIDPAQQNDNLAIVICELYDDHSRIVYSWITNIKDFEDRRKSGLTKEDGYYAFCARKIRDLMKVFPLQLIGIDTQGGGYALMEALEAVNTKGDSPLYPIIERGNKAKQKPTDRLSGLHIVEPIQFANYAWLKDSNYGLLYDMEQKKILFPRYDCLTAELSIIEDKIRVDSYKKETGNALIIVDSLEDSSEEIRELKNELSSITHARTSDSVGAREKWTVPEIKIDAHTKGSGKKDRYSALLISSYLARKLRAEGVYNIEYNISGGLVQNIKPEKGGSYYNGSSEYNNMAKNFGVV